MPNRFPDDLQQLSRAELLRLFLAANDEFLHEAKHLSFRDPKPDAYREAKERLHALMEELKQR
jgi:hypothetical protein